MTDQTQTTTEPVAWMYDLATVHDRAFHTYDGWKACLSRSKPDVPGGGIRNIVPLYTTPRPLAIGLDREAVADAMKRLAEDAENVAGLGAGMLGGERIAADIKTVLSALSAPAEGWQGIETAPKDGTGVIAFVPGFGMGSMVLSWFDGYWREPANHMGLKVSPTHWMPLPAAPTGGRS